MVVLDTNIIIDHLRQSHGKETVLMKIAKRFSKQNLGVSVVSVQELYEGRSTKNHEIEAYLLATIAPIRILPYTFEVAQLAGKIARDLSHPIELADAAIAATSVLHNAELATLNERDFQGIPELNLKL